MNFKSMFGIVGVINYVLVVFLNAFTDLGHKIIIQNTIFKVYDGDLQIVLTAIVNGLVLLPFVLLFSPSGFLADKFAKNKIMKHSALLAVFITLGITYSYYHGLFFLAFTMTFLLALQSAIYGPAKYGYIKELVGVKYISAGNGVVQATTTVAILGGIIFYTVLFEGMYDVSLMSESDILKAIAPLGWILVGSSIVEWYLASRLPNKLDFQCSKKFKFKKYIRGEYLFKNLKIIRRKKEIFESILALSLFWSISQVVLAVFGEFVERKLGVTNTIVVQGVMALAGVGIVVGSVIAANLSKYYIHTGFASIGAFGITIIVFLVPFTSSMSLLAFMFLLFGIFAGFIMVPLNAYIQFLSPNIHFGTILAGNNFIQNIFMFFFLMLTTLFAYFGMNAEMLFYLMGFIGLYLLFLLLKRHIVMTFWAFFEFIFSFAHKYNYVGLENIPQDKAVLFLGNHVSWIDWLVVQYPIRRRITFMMDKYIYNWKVFNSVFKKGKVIPVSPKASKDAFTQAHKRLQKGSFVAIFPEGKISTDGEIDKFHRGYEIMPSDYDGVIVPYFIDGAFGSLFSKYKKNQKRAIFKRREITVYFQKPVSLDTKADEVRDILIDVKQKVGEKSELK